MRSLQITLFVLAFILIGTQTFRHIYVKFLEPRSSVLDAYRDDTEAGIAAAESLDDLVAMYEEAREAVADYERDPTNPGVAVRDRRALDPYAAEMNIQAEIRTREAQANGIFKLRFYWTLGLLGVLLGVLCHLRFNPWVGMAAVIGGFSEMAFWTNPLVRVPGAGPEFESLLNHRLALSLATWGLLLAIWLLLDRPRKVPAEDA